MQPKQWLLVVAGLVGMGVGLAVDWTLFWTENSFRVLFMLPTGLLFLGLCHWQLSRRHK